MNSNISNKKIEDIILENGKFIAPPVGDSMWPLLRNRKDIMLIEKVDERLKRYDVPLYKRDSGQYVLHRILKVREHDYVICGDNRTCREYGITDKNIIGVLKGVYKDDKFISCNDKKYKIYVHLWCDLFYLRVFLIKIRNLFKKVRRKLK